MTGRKLDLTNKKFGKLTALRPIVGSTDKKRKWLCICDCGNLEEIETFQLNSNQRANCKNPICRTGFKIGDKYGSLTLLSYDKDKGYRAKLKCQCKCGSIKDYLAKNLQRNPDINCGCSKKVAIRAKESSAFNKVCSMYKSNAKSKGFCFNLSPEEMSELFKGNCHYCGQEPSNIMSTKHYQYVYNGIDRLDSCEGYIKENCVTCCSKCNYFKNSLHYEDFILLVRKIYKHLIEGLSI